MPKTMEMITSCFPSVRRAQRHKELEVEADKATRELADRAEARRQRSEKTRTDMCVPTKRAATSSS